MPLINSETYPMNVQITINKVEIKESADINSKTLKVLTWK